MNGIFIPRRTFLAGLGLSAGGLVLALPALSAPGAPKDEGSRAKPEAGPKPPPDLRADVFVHIAADGSVKIVCQRSEMGQGIRSTIPALIADELGADMARVTIVQADGDKMYGDQNTDGSRSIRGQYDALRRIGATARTMLVVAASKKWGVPASQCRADNHTIVHAPSKRSLGFGEVAEAAAKLPVPQRTDVVLKNRSELKTRGKILPLVDGPAIVTGKAIYGADVRLPGMLTAMIARPPVVGGKVARFDGTRATKVPGVKKLVELPVPVRPFKFQPLGGIAVVADNTWAAMRGRAALDITWDDGANATYDSASYKDALTKALDGPGKTARQKGDAKAALAKAAQRVEAEYFTPHLPHAAMEPLVAVAKFENGVCEVWAPTQNPQAARTEIARALGIDEKHVAVHVTLLGGGFGRKSKADYCAEAALVAKAMGVPVRVQWSREDDMQHDYYHTTATQRLAAGLDTAGKLTAWHHRVAFPPIGSIFNDATFAGEGDMQQGVLDLPLAAAHVLAEHFEAKAMTRIGWLRSVANTYHAFAAQSFIDEIAQARQKDPLDNLLEVLGPPRIVTLEELGVPKVPNYGQSLDEHPIDTGRHHRVVQRVAEMARWRSRKADGKSLGIAVHRSFLAYVACVVSVARDKAGRVRVDEAWIVADAGTIANIDRARSQLEGAVVFGLGHALYGSITMKRGRTVESNFRDFHMMRMDQTPRAIHVEVLETDGPAGGIGEPGVPPVAPALANAIFALTGTRVRTLPIARMLPAV